MVDHQDVAAAAEAVVAVLPEDAVADVAASVAADAAVDGEFGLIPMQMSQYILRSMPVLLRGSSAN